MKAVYGSLAAVPLVLAVAGYAWCPPFKYATWALTGRSPYCPLSQAVRSADNLQAEIRDKDAILRASKLLQTDSAGYELWQTPKGRFWIPAGSRYVLPFNLAEQQRKIYGVAPNGPQANDITLDCGANVGVTVNEELAAGAKKIVAIEPAPENLECLRRNFANEIAAGRVVIVPKGVWDKNDTLTLRVDPQNSAADSFVMKREHTVNVTHVPLTTIDEIVTELNLPRVDYIKFDIEGAEPRALAGARNTLAKWKPRLSVAAYHQPDHPKVIPEIIRAARSDYQMECGPCAADNTHVRPDVLYFR